MKCCVFDPPHVLARLFRQPIGLAGKLGKSKDSAQGFVKLVCYACCKLAQSSQAIRVTKLFLKLGPFGFPLPAFDYKHELSGHRVQKALLLCDEKLHLKLRLLLGVEHLHHASFHSIDYDIRGQPVAGFGTSRRAAVILIIQYYPSRGYIRVSHGWWQQIGYALKDLLKRYARLLNQSGYPVKAVEFLDALTQFGLRSAACHCYPYGLGNALVELYLFNGKEVLLSAF
ncbi:hypothetical protein ES703_04563 [subsurface metagenome]